MPDPMQSFGGLTPQGGTTGAQAAPSPNPGIMADSFSKIGIAVQVLSEALPGLPVGDEIQKAVIDAIQKLSKVAPASSQVPGVQTTQLAGIQEQANKTAMLQALQRALSAQGGGAPPADMGGGQPPMQPPPGAPPAMM